MDFSDLGGVAVSSGTKKNAGFDFSDLGGEKIEPKEQISSSQSGMPQGRDYLADLKTLGKAANLFMSGPTGFGMGMMESKIQDIIKDPRGEALSALDSLPAVGSVVAPLAVAAGTGGIGIGSAAAASGLGAAGGEGLRQIGRRFMGENPTPAVEMPFVGGDLPKIPYLNKEASNLIEQGAIQAGLDLTGSAISYGVKKAAAALKDLQKMAAESALGGSKSIFNKTRGGVDRFENAAVSMQEKGVFGPFTKTQTMLERATEIQSDAYQQMDNIFKTIDKSKPGIVDKTSLIEKLKAELSPKILTGTGKESVSAFNNVIETFDSSPGSKMSLSDLQEIKKSIGGQVNYGIGHQLTPQEKIYSRAAGIINKHIEDVADQAAKDIPDITNSLSEAKKIYGDSSEIVKGLTDKLQKKGNRFFDLAASGAGIGALLEAISKDPVGASQWLATAAGAKYLQTFGPQQGAIIFRSLSDGLKALPKEAPAIATKSFSQMIKNSQERNNKK